jgi:hypothetical protein
MNVIAMPGKIVIIADVVISKTSLPNLSHAELKSERVRVSAPN